MGAQRVLTAPPRPARPVEPPRPTGAVQTDATGRRLPGETATTAALAFLSLASAFGLTRVFSGKAWIAPVAATVIVTHLVLWLMRRWRLPQLIAAPIGTATVGLMVVWTVFGSTTYTGFPGRETWHAVGAAIVSLGSGFASSVAPVAPVRSFEMLAAVGGGLVAVLSDWAAFRWRSPMLAVIPGLATFVACCTAAQTKGRGLVIAVEIVALCAFLLVQQNGTVRRQVWFAGTDSGAMTWWVEAGAVAGGLALLVGLILTPSLARQDGRAVYGWRGGLGSSGGVRIVPNPIVSLQTRLIRLSTTPVFTVRSSVPSYWRLTALDTFDGINWKSTGAYRGFSSRLPGIGSVPPATRTVNATFHIQALDSVWLPDAFNPVSVAGLQGVEYDSSSNSLLTNGRTTDGLTYTVTSYQLLSTLSSQDLAAAPPVGSQSGLSQYLALPASVYGPISALAMRITAQQTTEYGKALAIQDFLRSAPFSYSLYPAMDGAGQAALYNFLFVTHAGYCQQFAGAYAVLARAAGLPTRLAVGFTTGAAQSDGTFEVEDKDAHTWPEVYFGPKYGWVPFEPTPPFSQPGTSGYSSPGSSPLAPDATSPTTDPSSDPTAPATSKNNGTNQGSPVDPLEVPTAALHSASQLTWVLPLLGSVGGLAIVWVGANAGGPALLRRRRRRKLSRGGPAGMVRNMWDEVCTELSWHGLSPARDETDVEFARRATDTLGHRYEKLSQNPREGEDGSSSSTDSLLRSHRQYETSRRLLPPRSSFATASEPGPALTPRPVPNGGLTGLAQLAGAAAFGPVLEPAALDSAQAAADDVRQHLSRTSSRKNRLARLVVPLAVKRRLDGQSSSLWSKRWRSRSARSSNI
ncbi:MAG: transglutaminase domain-containing protein [Acidimicrobiales bacterium]|nr:transglutaminase domain-containing protein [Acidimicrobiales bacterium]